LSWAALDEGAADQAYLELLIPRVMEDIILMHGIRHSTIPHAPAVRLQRDHVDKVAREACAARDAFYLVFIHADTGGRALEANTKGVPPALPGRQSKFDVSGGMPRLSIDETPEREPPKHTHMEFHRWTNTKA